jgi:hypothetical protein
MEKFRVGPWRTSGNIFVGIQNVKNYGYFEHFPSVLDKKWTEFFWKKLNCGENDRFMARLNYVASKRNI